VIFCAAAGDAPSATSVARATFAMIFMPELRDGLRVGASFSTRVECSW
jgi:hypothetical protein